MLIGNQCKWNIIASIGGQTGFFIEGVQTTIPPHEALPDNEGFQKGEYDIHWLEKWLEAQD